MAPRNLNAPPLYQAAAPQVTDPYYGDYSALARQFLQKYSPVYSAGQGIANVAGDLAEAYAQKTALDKARTQENQGYQDLAQALATAGNQNPSVPANMSDQLFAKQPDQFAAYGGTSPLGVANPDQSSGTPTPTADVTPQGRTNRAMAQLIAQGPLGARVGAEHLPEIQQAAQSATPPPIQWQDVQAGHTLLPRDPTTGNILNMPGGPQAISGGPPLSPEATAAQNAGLVPGTKSYQDFLRAQLQKDLPTTWRTATPDEMVQHGFPASAKGGQVSSTGEFKPPERQAGQIGPAYDSQTGQPLGVVDYTDPTVAPKLAAGDMLPHEPKILQGADLKDLQDKGNVYQELKQQLAEYKPGYGRTIASTSKLRGYMGGKAFNDASEWFNKTNNVLLPTVKNIAGRSPQLIEAFNENRPEPTDADDVVLRKMNNLIGTYGQELQNIGRTYKKGGYLGSQIDSATGFVPNLSSAAGTNAMSGTFDTQSPAGAASGGWSIKRVQ